MCTDSDRKLRRLTTCMLWSFRNKCEMTFVAVVTRQEAAISSSGDTFWLTASHMVATSAKVSMEVSHLVRQTVLEECESFSLVCIVCLPSSEVKLC